jgi:SAM-dependent methyltransferase
MNLVDGVTSGPDDLSMVTIFRALSSRGVWGSTETSSGIGSERAGMARVVPGLEVLLRRQAIGSLLDAPCGDGNWIRDVNLTGISYLGVDILPEHVAAARRNCENCDFVVADITSDLLPAADLILCRDGLVHLSFQHGRQALENFRRNRARYLLATTFPETVSNVDIATGQWRPLNMCRPPFDFPAPLDLIGDWPGVDGYHDKSLALWAVADL